MRIVHIVLLDDCRAKDTAGRDAEGVHSRETRIATQRHLSRGEFQIFLGTRRDYCKQTACN